MHVLWTLIVGLVAGGLAKLAMPGRQPGGVVVTMLLGLAGAIVADILGIAAHLYGPGSRPGIIASAFGAIIVLGAYRMILRRREISAPVRR
jgi:uncharacterized membrane protein YeaQ/YmgE (transglycosylase-associated protein family)